MTKSHSNALIVMYYMIEIIFSIYSTALILFGFEGHVYYVINKVVSIDSFKEITGKYPVLENSIRIKTGWSLVINYEITKRNVDSIYLINGTGLKE